MTPWTPASSTGVDACCTMATDTARREPACARCPRSERSRIADAAAIRRSPSDSRFNAIQVDAIAGSSRARSGYGTQAPVPESWNCPTAGMNSHE